MANDDQFDALRHAVFMDTNSVNLDVDAIKIALMFREEDSWPSLILVCNRRSDMPYMRRAIMELLGAPNSMHDNELKYEGYRIKLMNLDMPSLMFMGYDPATAFYVPYADRNEKWQAKWDDLVARGL